MKRPVLILALFLPVVGHEIVTLDRTIHDDVLTITKGSNGIVVTTVSGREVVNGADLRRIIFESRIRERLADDAYLVGLFNGDRVAGELRAAEDGKLKLKVEHVGELDIPFTDVRAIVFTEGVDALITLTEIENQRGRTSDQIVLRSGTPVDGIFVDKVSKERVFFELDDKPESIALSQVQAVTIAEIAGVSPSARKRGSDAIKVTLINGVEISGLLSSYAAEKLTIDDVFGTRVTLKSSVIRQVDLFNPRVVYLSELIPTAIEHRQALIGLSFPPRFDLNCMNPPGPLSVDGRIYDTGLGVHTFSSLTFDLGKLRATRFRGLVGLDDSAKEAALSHPNFPAPARVQIFLDDLPLYEEALELGVRGRAHIIDAPVEGRQKLRLVADFGKSYDMLGRVDWVDAYFVIGP